MPGLGILCASGFNQAPPQVPSEAFYYTEGMEDVSWVEGYSFSASGSVSKNVDHLYLKAGNVSSPSGRTWVTDQTVDLTNIKTLFVEWENIGLAVNQNNSYLVVSTDKMGSTGTYNARYHRYRPFTKRIESIDVSALTGKYHIRVHAYDSDSSVDATSELKVYRVWGEP